MAKEEISESRPMQVQSADRYEGRLMLKEQLCNLKYKCIVSIAILLVLLLETIARRIEESVKNPTSSTQLWIFGRTSLSPRIPFVWRLRRHDGPETKNSFFHDCCIALEIWKVNSGVQTSSASELVFWCSPLSNCLFLQHVEPNIRRVARQNSQYGIREGNVHSRLDRRDVCISAKRDHCPRWSGHGHYQRYIRNFCSGQPSVSH